MSNQGSTNTRDGKAKAQDLLSNTIAGYGTIYVAPMIYELTVPIAEKFMTNTYGDDIAILGVIAHGLTVLLVTFLTLRIAIGVAIAFIVAATGRYGFALMF
ncbi:MAG: hypothetical protein COA58_16705 [Bacteroidetes bacterium]|nr:MAG: hypothetical protein COA58_16705 [Bacteroidota bacterium]